MNRYLAIRSIRAKLKSKELSLGSWMQLPNGSVAEIMGQSGYDWVALDLEHGSFSLHQLPDLFRALELGGTLPLVRLAEGSERELKGVLDAGAGGVIIPKIETSAQLERACSFANGLPVVCVAWVSPELIFLAEGLNLIPKRRKPLYCSND